MKTYLEILFLFAVSFWLSVSAQAVTPAKEQIARIGNGAEPRELDPAISTGVPESKILDNLFEGLTTLDPFTLEPIPGVAKSWTVSKDGKVYTFKLRHDAKWSDGRAITAEDFVWSWRRAVSPKLASEYAYQLYYIKNGEKINLGAIKDLKRLGVSALDKHTLKVELENPTPFFLKLAAFHTLYPIPRHIVEKHSGQSWTRPGVMVTNGAFKLSEWKLNQHIKVVPNEYYWDRSKVRLTAAYFYPIENLDTEERTFFAGKLTMTYEVPHLKIPVYKKQQKRKPSSFHPYRSDPYLGTYFYRFNVTKKPLNDKRVRRALALAIDRTLIVEKITKGGQRPAGTFTPPNTAGYTAANVLPPRVTPETIKEAKKLLTEAGYPNGKGLPKVEILYNTSENHRKIAIAIQQMWKRNLGISVGLYNQEWKVYLNTQKKLNYQVSRAGWIGDYPDPNTFLDMWLKDGGNNNTGWWNAEYEKLIAAAAKEIDQKKRYDYFRKAEKILMDELPIMPIYVYTKPRLVSEKLRMVDGNNKIVNFAVNIQDRLMLKSFVLVK